MNTYYGDKQPYTACSIWTHTTTVNQDDGIGKQMG